MSKLNQHTRAKLRDQLLTAMLPDSTEQITNLEHAAFRAVLTSYYTANGLRRIAGFPPHWLCKVDSLRVKASGQPYWERIHGPATLLPGKIDENHPHDAKAQAAIDLWYDTKRGVAREREALSMRLQQLINGCSTLAVLLDRLPEARDLLQLPPAETDDAIAESVRATLRVRGLAA